jgi:acyl carrier protein
MEDIAAVVRQFVLRTFLAREDSNELTDQTRLITGGLLDSISTLKLVTFLEDHFCITIEVDASTVEQLDTIGRITAIIAEMQRRAHALLHA